MSTAVPAVRAQNDAPSNEQQSEPHSDALQGDAPADAVEPPPVVSVLEEAKLDAIVELLMTSYAAALAMHVAIRGAECTADQPRCAPLFFAQDVVLAPWNVVQLLKMTNEQPDPDPTVVQCRIYTIHEPRSAGVLPPDMVSLAQYAVGQQVALYSHLEAWRISIDRYRTASAISAEDEQAARDDLRGNGFGPDLQAWFSDSPAWASVSTRAANPSSTQSPSPPPWRQKYRVRVLSTSEKRSNHFERG